MDGLIRRAAVAAGAAVALVGPAVWAAGPAAASTAVLYAYAGGTGSPTGCPQDTTGTASNECSLGAALTQAGPGDTIDLATPGGAAHYVGNWTVGTTGTSAGAPVTIKAAAGLASQPVLDGNQGGPVLDVQAGQFVALSGIIITNGSGNGGGLDNAGTVTITGSTFTGNTGYYGGAIDNADGFNGGTGSVTLTDSTFTGNTATLGGAIFSGGNGGNGTLTVTDSTFTGNAAASGYAGGAIANGYGGTGTLTVTGSTFTSNTSSWGAAIDTGDVGGGGTATVTGSTFTGNTSDNGGAINSGANGGAGTVTVTASTFSGNTAGAGGAIDSGAGGGAGTVTVTASTFSGDTATISGYGAEINSLGSGTVQVAGDLFNGSCYQGGGTWTDGGYNAGTGTSCFASTPPASDTSGSAVGSDLQTALTANGGPTQTLEPTTGNPAIGLITNPTTVTLGSNQVTLCPATDQRGYASASGAKCDAGAVQTTGSPPADLSLANTGAPNPVVHGHPLTYTIKATNTSAAPVSLVRVTDRLPASLTFGSMATTHGSCVRHTATAGATMGGTVICRAKQLAAHHTMTITITVTPTKAGTLADKATITASSVATASATAKVTVT